MSSLIPQQPLTNHQKYTIAFHQGDSGKITCSFSQHGVFLGRNVPLLIPPDHPPSLNSYTLTYFPHQKTFVWMEYGLKGGMKNEGSGIQNTGTLSAGRDIITGPTNITKKKYQGPTPIRPGPWKLIFRSF